MKNAKIYLKESVLDRDGYKDSYVGGNMSAIDCENVAVYRDGVTFTYMKSEYFLPFSNLLLVRWENEK